jgi:hypothetical protein
VRLRAIAGRRGEAISGIRRVLVLRGVRSSRCRPTRSVLQDGPSVPRLLRCARNDEDVVADMKWDVAPMKDTTFRAATFIFIHSGGSEVMWGLRGTHAPGGVPRTNETAEKDYPVPSSAPAGACPEHRRRKVQKLTGGLGGVPPGSFLFGGGGGAAQSDAQQTRRAPGAHHFHGSSTRVVAHHPEMKMDLVAIFRPAIARQARRGNHALLETALRQLK